MGTKKRSDRSIAWGASLILFGLSMLFWNGTFHSSDGLSTYAVVDSLARYGRFDTEQVRWLGYQQGIYGPDGLLYSQKGLATSLTALPLAVAGMLLPGLGPVHTSLLLMPLVTAFSGALLYLAGRRAFPTLPRHAVVLATLAWGLGSLAWPYSKTFFSEPLTALSTIGAVERLLAFADAEPRSRREFTAALGLGCWLGLGVLARPAHAVVLPVFVPALMVLTWRRHWSGFTRSHFTPLAAGVAPLIAAGALTLWYNWARFGSPLVTGYLPQESFSVIWWQGLAGLSISPGRGLLWYAPWLVMVVGGLPLAWRRSRLVAAASVASCLVYLLLYAKWHLWHGGYCWGPRFLVPIVPLLALLAVPVAARWPRLFGSLAAVGIGVNLIGVAWRVDQHQAQLEYALALFDPRTLFEPRYAQIPGVLRLARRATLDVAWIIGGDIQPALAALAIALASVGVLGGLLLASGRPLRVPGLMGREQAASHLVVILLLAAMTYAFLWQAGTVQPAGYRKIADAINAHSPPGTMIWNNDHPHISTFLNLYKGRGTVLGVYEPEDTLSSETQHWLFSLAVLPQPVWVINRGSVGTPGPLERTAAQHRGVVQMFSVATSTHRVAGPTQETEPLKATLYFDAPDWRSEDFDLTLGTDKQQLIRLDEAALSGDTEPGGVMAVRLVWEELVPGTAPLQVRVQLIDPSGIPRELDVGLLENGNTAVSSASPRETITRVHAFGLPADATGGDYGFVVTVNDLASTLPLRTTDGRDELALGPISLVP
jgi:hypothetical protein